MFLNRMEPSRRACSGLPSSASTWLSWQISPAYHVVVMERGYGIAATERLELLFGGLAHRVVYGGDGVRLPMVPQFTKSVVRSTII